VLSTYLEGFAIDLKSVNSYLGSINSHPDKNGYVSKSADEEAVNSFYACTADQFYLFSYQSNNRFSISHHYMTKISPLTCCVAIRINKNNPYLKAYAKPEDKMLTFITGHRNGKVYKWSNFNHKEEVYDYKSEILAMTCFDFGIVIVTDSSFVYFWDLGLNNCFK